MSEPSRENSAAEAEPSGLSAVYILSGMGLVLLVVDVAAAWILLPHFIDVFKQFRVDLPVATLLVLQLARKGPMIAFASLVLVGVTGAVIGKSWRAALIIVILLSALTVASVAMVALPLQAIERARNGKR